MLAQRNPNLPLPPQNAPSLDKYLTTEEVAQRLGVSIFTIRLRAKEGFLHPIRVTRDQWRLKRGDPNFRGAPGFLFNPVEVENEINRIDALHEARKLPPPRTPMVGKISEPSSTPSSSPSSPSSPPPPSPPPPLPPPVRNEPAKSIARKNIDQSIFTGEQCAQAVKLFRDGKNQLDVVVEMQVTFEVAEHFWNCYLKAQPGWFMPSKMFAKVRGLIEWEEESPTPDGFERALRKFVESECSRATKDVKDKTEGVPKEDGLKEAPEDEELTQAEKDALAKLDKETSGDE